MSPRLRPQPAWARSHCSGARLAHRTNATSLATLEAGEEGRRATGGIAYSSRQQERDSVAAGTPPELVRRVVGTPDSSETGDCSVRTRVLYRHTRVRSGSGDRCGPAPDARDLAFGAHGRRDTAHVEAGRGHAFAYCATPPQHPLPAVTRARRGSKTPPAAHTPDGAVQADPRGPRRVPSGRFRPARSHTQFVIRGARSMSPGPTRVSQHGAYACSSHIAGSLKPRLPWFAALGGRRGSAPPVGTDPRAIRPVPGPDARRGSRPAYVRHEGRRRSLAGRWPRPTRSEAPSRLLRTMARTSRWRSGSSSWHEEHSLHKRPGTLFATRSAIRRHIVPRLGHRQLHDSSRPPTCSASSPPWRARSAPGTTRSVYARPASGAARSRRPRPDRARHRHRGSGCRRFPKTDVTVLRPRTSSDWRTDACPTGGR